MDARLLETVKALPKIELHRHLEGSVRLSTLVEVAQEYGIEMPEYDIETMRPFVQMMPGEPHDSQHFLGKFRMLRQFYRSREVARRITREAVLDAAADNVRYMELRFTPMALCKASGASIDEMVQIVCEAACLAAEEADIKVRLITSMNRHEAVEIGEKVLEASLRYRDMGIVALDLAGDEANYSALPFRDLFLKARDHGFNITVHAGEWAGAASVWDAVGNLGATRVGHGINVLSDPAMVNVLIEREIVLEVCPGSNVLSGVVSSMSEHPLAQLTAYDVLTTINTDDPSVCNSTLSDEMVCAIQDLDLTLDDIKAAILRAARAAFLPIDERDALVREFTDMLADS